MHESFCKSVVMPNSPEYLFARQEFNRSIQKFPCSIAYCSNEDEVIMAIHAAKEHGCKMRIRSGGHSYEGFSVGNCTDVIDVSCIDFINIDEDAGTITVGPGVLNRDLYEAVGVQGFPFPSGTCPTVAVAGLTLGGGWGLSARMFGLTCDNLLSATLIDFCGNCHLVNAECEKELYFALRGGGSGNFGVVTSLTYSLPPRIFNVTYVEMNASDVSKLMATKFIQYFQEWLLLDDWRCTPIARVYQTPEETRSLVLRGIYYGNQEQAKESLLRFCQMGLECSFVEMSFLEAIRIVEEGYPSYEKFTTGGRFSIKPFFQKDAEQIVTLIDDLAEGSIGGFISLYGLGGAVKNLTPNNTAFFYRNAINIITLSTNWEEDYAKPQNLRWFASRYRLLRNMTWGSYVNFPNLENMDYMCDYYGGNEKRLKNIKAYIDPENWFCFPQSIN